jgi:L-asparaginase II
MRALTGWIAKGGAEGLLCAAGHGIGVALKARTATDARSVRPPPRSSRGSSSTSTS